MRPVQLKHTLFMGLSSLGFLAASQVAAVPVEMNYQGRLVDADGNPKMGHIQVSIGIYTNSEGGAPVYEEDVGVIPVQNGVYTFQFGTNFPALKSALLNDQCWLELSIDGEPFAPRQQLLTVPFAVRSREVECIDGAATFEAGVVTEHALADGSISSHKIAPGAVKTNHLNSGVDARFVNADGDVMVGDLIILAKLGIGTDSPSSPLEIVGEDVSGAFILRIFAGPAPVAWAKKK
jgi:hypothetical protein